MNDKILIVAAHPDDEILGCGGTISRLVKKGCDVFTLILGEGVTLRDRKRNPKKREKELKDLKKQALQANYLLGVKEVLFFDLPDNRFDTVPFLDIVKFVEKIKSGIKPGVIFTHYENDLNIDHGITYKAVLTATRPVKKESVKEIYSFAIPSSTEWAYPVLFSPDVFFDISGGINLKLKAFKKYKGERREYPHPRSAEGIRSAAKFWGMGIGLKYAEPFKSVRVVR